jgi:UDP-3-O-[3-hydroxymyristoyl] glucosamine N-acyltransferase
MGHLAIADGNKINAQSGVNKSMTTKHSYQLCMVLQHFAMTLVRKVQAGKKGEKSS